MKITVFGGAFDPPHQGHLQIARELLKQKLADEVWFLPVKEHAFLKKLSAPAVRVEMLHNILEPGMKIEEFELNQTGTNFTYQTLCALKQKYPEHQFSFVIGSDNLTNFHKWNNFTELLEKFQVFVYPRQGFSLEPLYSNMHILHNVPAMAMSSSSVQKAILQTQPISHLVTLGVAQYIEENKLYQTAKESNV